MRALWLTLSLLVATKSLARADIRDFIIESEDDLRRLGAADDEHGLGDESDFYDGGDESMMYGQCGGGGVGEGVEQFAGNEVTLSDFMMMSDGSADVSSLFQDGRINEEMLLEAVKKALRESGSPDLFDHAKLKSVTLHPKE